MGSTRPREHETERDAAVGNLVGAAVFVAGGYYYLYGRVEEDAAGPRASNGGGDGRAVSAEPETVRSGA